MSNDKTLPPVDLNKLIEQAKSAGWTEGYIAGLEYARNFIADRARPAKPAEAA